MSDFLAKLGAVVGGTILIAMYGVGIYLIWKFFETLIRIRRSLEEISNTIRGRADQPAATPSSPA